LRDGIEILSGWCDAGVHVVFVTQQLDLSGPVGRPVSGVLFEIAEREHSRERQAAGITVAKRKGIYTKAGVGGPQRVTVTLIEHASFVGGALE